MAQAGRKRERSSPTPSLDITYMTRDLQQRIYDYLDLPSLAASARVSRAWLRAIRENSLLPALCRLRHWHPFSLRRLAVHLTWQSVVPSSRNLPLQPPMAAPLLVLDSLAAWLTHDNEHEAGLQLLQHVRQLVSTGGNSGGNIAWSSSVSPVQQQQREWLSNVDILPTSSTLRLSTNPVELQRETHVRIAFALSSLPHHRFYLKLDFQPTTEKSILSVMYQPSLLEQRQQQDMTLLLTSDATELYLCYGAPVTYNPQTAMYFLPKTPSMSRTTMLEQLGIDDTRSFLRGVCLLASFVYEPAAQQLLRQIEAM